MVSGVGARFAWRFGLRLASLICVFAVCSPTTALSASSSVVMQAMKQELARSQKLLGQQTVTPYFISYGITQTEGMYVTGSFGALTGSRQELHRVLDVDVRVGSPEMDNTRQIRGRTSEFAFPGHPSPIEVPVDDDLDFIRAVLWYRTDKTYQQAVEQLTRAQTNTQVETEQEDRSADFSHDVSQHYSEPLPHLKIDKALLEDKVRKYTAAFASYADIYEATAVFVATAETRWYANTEGSEIQTAQTYYRLYIQAVTKAADGMELPRFETFWASAPERLPDDHTVLSAVQKIISDLRALQNAPVVDPYVGPAILSGRASAVFFHEVFGHRLEGHRLKRDYEGQTFKRRINEQVLPTEFSVYSDPTVHRLANQDLAGSYDYDSEGIRARKVFNVENGVLRNFLMSRTLIDGFPNSNGHGRNQPGFASTARQSNLIIEASRPVSHEQLKKMLIEEIKQQKKPFGLLFDDITGGFTITRRIMPNAFNVMPVMVYRVYPDGTEQLVRGVDLIGTPLTAFTNIVAADDQPAVFNGFCVAESGAIPVSTVSPALLFSEVEVQKKSKSQERSPILPFGD